jgi:fructose-specific phosphotransferase system IIC component
VPSFTSAFFGALILSFITGIFTGWEKKRQRRVVRTGPAAKSGGVIDI